MNLWNQVPFLRLLIPFVIGIIIAVYYPETSFSDCLSILLCCLFLIAVQIHYLKWSYRYRWIFGICVNLFLLLSGYQASILNMEKFDTRHYSKWIATTDYIFVEVNELQRETENSYRMVMRVKALAVKGEYLPASGKLIMYFEKDNLIEKLHYGDGLVLRSALRNIPSKQNPAEFDYRRYLYFRHIYHVAYVRSGMYRLTTVNEGNSVFYFAGYLKTLLLNSLKENELTGEAFAVSAGLILGHVNEIETKTYAAFANTGTLHILSVSGLHVGLVYVAFGFLLSFLPASPLVSSIKLTLLILLLWLYALLTGLSPSVVRSATMFSFLSFALAYNKYVNQINLLCASCLFLLLIEPFMITDVGFQLSYFAVLGILLVQPAFQVYKPRNIFTKAAWNIVAVSIAAQIFTFPLTLYYFKQFPNYFLISNLVVIPISSWIIYCGMLLFMFDPVKIIAVFLGKLLLHLIHALTSFVHFINRIPYVLTENVNINLFEVFMVYALISYALLFIFFKRYRYLKLLLITAILFLFNAVLITFKKNTQQKFFVYNIRNTSAFDFVVGRQNCLLLDDEKNRGYIDFHAKPNWLQCGIGNPQILYMKEIKSLKNDILMLNDKFIQFRTKRILFVDNKLPDVTGSKIDVDYIILGRDVPIHLETIQRQYNFKKVIVDASNSKKNTETWLREGKHLGIDCYAVTKSGAYEEEISQ